jgi:hypothetical protein
MARTKTTDDVSTLQMALVGYEIEKKRVEAKILELKARLKGKKVTASAVAVEPGSAKRNLSEAARKRISDAQRKRWAIHRKAKAQAAKQQ